MRKYDEPTKARAVHLAAVTNQGHAAREMGVPQQTLSRWLAAADHEQLRAYVEQVRAEAAAEIGSLMVETSRSIMEAVRDARTREEAAAARDRSISFGIMSEKMLLLGGTSSSGRFGNAGPRDERVPLDLTLLDNSSGPGGGSDPAA